MNKLLLGVIVHSPEEHYELPKHLVGLLDVCIVKNSDTDYLIESVGNLNIEVDSNLSIGLKRGLVLQAAIANKYNKLTFIDPDDQVLDYNYLLEGKDLDSHLVCCEKLRGEIVDESDNSPIEFRRVKDLPPKLNHGPMNIIDVKLCEDNDINYSDLWIDDVDFFLRYPNYIDKDKVWYTDKPCYNHIKTPGSLSDMSDRFLESAKVVRKGKEDYNDSSFKLFCEWYDNKFRN